MKKRSQVPRFQHVQHTCGERELEFYLPPGQEFISRQGNLAQKQNLHQERGENWVQNETGTGFCPPPFTFTQTPMEEAEPKIRTASTISLKKKKKFYTTLRHGSTAWLQPAQITVTNKRLRGILFSVDTLRPPGYQNLLRSRMTEGGNCTQWKGQHLEEGAEVSQRSSSTQRKQHNFTAWAKVAVMPGRRGRNQQSSLIHMPPTHNPVNVS